MKSNFDSKKYMRLAIDEMKKSKNEIRNDGKECPKVGAVLVSPDEKFVEQAHRGQFREGDHAEYTLLDKQYPNKNLTGYYLFTTLEPCAPGARKSPKLGCAERIVNARIKKVWIGLEDQDPLVDRMGIKYLEDKGVEVVMFDPEFQSEIREVNKNFIDQALDRSKQLKITVDYKLNLLENKNEHVTFEDFNLIALQTYIEKSKIDLNLNSEDFKKLLIQQGFLDNDFNTNNYYATGNGILLFGKRPKDKYPQATLKAEVWNNTEPIIETFDDPLVLIPEKVESWLNKNLPLIINRQQFERKEVSSFPIPPLREAIINALIHRDYAIGNAKNYLILEKDKITIKSPGTLVSPLDFKRFQNFEASSLSRNPKLVFVFNEMRFAEERGIGLKEMKSLTTKYNLPVPKITYEDPYIIITFFTNWNFLEDVIGKKKYKKLNEEEIKAIEFIYKKDEVKKDELASFLKISDKAAQRILSKLSNKEHKIITRIGQSVATRYKLSQMSS